MEKMVGPGRGGFAGPTACEVLGLRAAARARSHARGYVEMGYLPGSLVLLAVRGGQELVTLAFGAWWAGLTVAVVPGGDYARRDRTAVEIGASLQVCDAADIVDEEHLRHRDVPAFAPSQFHGVPVRWAPRCRPGDEALTVMVAGRATGSMSHQDLMSGVAASSGRDLTDPGQRLIIATVRALADRSRWV